MQTVEIDGYDQLVRNLNTIKDKALKKATRAGINAGMTPLLKSMRQVVSGTSWPPPEKKGVRQNIQRIKHDVKKTVGKKLKMYKGEYQAKIGFGAGKKRMTREQGIENRAQRRAAGRGGVGIGVQNIHWFVLGTKTMLPRLFNVVPQAVAMAKSEVFSSATKKMKEVLEREANRLPK